MRGLIVLGLISALTAPALGQDAVEQGKAAYQAFNLGIFDGIEATPSSAFDALTAGLAGNWTELSRLMVTTQDNLEQRFATSCDSLPVTIALNRPYAIDFHHGKSGNVGYSFSYLYRGGSWFSAEVDPKEFFEYLGVDGDALRDQALVALSRAVSDVLIFRPSPDILVVAKQGSRADIYARCGGSTLASPAAADPAAAALGAIFEKEFGTEKQSVRDAFVACAVAALAPMSQLDKDLLVKLNFDPPEKERNRFNATYPDLQGALLACGNAAQAAAQ